MFVSLFGFSLFVRQRQSCLRSKSHIDHTVFANICHMICCRIRKYLSQHDGLVRFVQACQKQGGWGLQPPNNLLNFVDFISERGSENQGHANEDSNADIFEEAVLIDQECNNL